MQEEYEGEQEYIGDQIKKRIKSQASQIGDKIKKLIDGRYVMYSDDKDMILYSKEMERILSKILPQGSVVRVEDGIANIQLPLPLLFYISRDLYSE